ncbi:regulatory LuxR family protein [Prauserella shujinwangii]|uniref:Regulatory LuxR family protein n=1 Tax=Prauserella shujinwangii TaxID=1453103 RepID=A0A2T0LNY5_9PSEU|nr:helix-turn-helix transcriptional regulator [Prauserella shujinwangii]PRX44945.1 regulatory LuxR family protein [Prauserella shujinwangii]
MFTRRVGDAGEHGAPMLGRRTECEAVERLLARARTGNSGALVLRGEAGIGKTALLGHARAAATGFRVEHATGIESEVEFAFAGLHQLCAPMLDRLDALPEPQQVALGVALGLRSGEQPNRFLVGLAVLTLMAEVAEERPLLCLLDDAQWLDEASAQTLAFVARRVAAERVALVFAVRDPDRVTALDGLPELRLAGLDTADALALLASQVPLTLDERVRDQIVAEARGNPLALLELPRLLEPEKLAGGFGLPDALSVPHRIEESFQRRSADLPAGTRLLLLVAAAEPVGDAALLWSAAAELGIGAEAAAPAEQAGLLDVGPMTVRFRHPLVRSAIYRAASPSIRRRVHAALAEVTDVRSDPDRRAWHRAHAVLGSDEEVAAELELSAGRARARGGLAAAAAFLERATTLTPDPAARARRALAAAYAKHEAGASRAALELLTAATDGPLDELRRARAQLLRAQISFTRTRGSEAAGMLLDAAKVLDPLAPDLARETYLQAIEAAILAGPFCPEQRVLEVVAANVTARASGARGPVEELFDGLVTTFTHSWETAVPVLRRVLESLRGHEMSVGDVDRRWLWLAARIAVAVWDDETLSVLADRNVRIARGAGALGTLPYSLEFLATVLIHTGELVRGAELIAQVAALRHATGDPPLNRARIMLAAWSGQQDEAAELYTALTEDATDRGEGASLAQAEYALSVLHNGLGNYDAALAAAERACEFDELVHTSLALPELIEAAVRGARPARAADALGLLSARAHASGTPWALGLEARSRALTSTGPAAEALYREAVDRLGGCRMATHLARAHLVYGEWLRREGRRHVARDQLRIAHDMLTAMGATAYATRAARELRATGENPRRRTAQPVDQLTAQELHIARLVATGATSKEVGAQLFLSPRTIDAHLRSIFRKLDITSRRQLRNMPLP